jgi:hypothetical protein
LPETAVRYWLCPTCGHRNEWRGTSRKCQGCGGTTRRKKRVPAHARVLRDLVFEDFARLSQEIHGGEYGACGVCGRLPKDTRNMDREHGHDPSEVSFGRVRGLACPGNQGCNAVMARLTLARARQIVAYLERVEAFYGG